MTTVGTMVHESDFEDQAKLVEYLASQLVRGRLAVFLGTGASNWYGLPDWDELVVRMYELADAGRPDKALDVRDQAEDLFLGKLKGDNRALLSLVHNALYSYEGPITLDFEKIRGDNLLASVGALLMASRRGSVSQVVTLNYDDLLEKYLGFHGFVVESVSKPNCFATYADVHVLHPHGYVPFEGTGVSSRILLTRKSYSEGIGEDWRRLCLTVLRHHTILFVGLSGRDDSLDSLVVNARSDNSANDHPAIIENSPYWGVSFGCRGSAAAKRWRDRGVFFSEVANYETALPTLIFTICQTASRLRSR